MIKGIFYVSWAKFQIIESNVALREFHHFLFFSILSFLNKIILNLLFALLIYTLFFLILKRLHRKRVFLSTAIYMDEYALRTLCLLAIQRELWQTPASPKGICVLHLHSQ
jgi:hypothetical protein